jgi:formate/nitrite transporter FocA (FNT family)
LKVPLHVPAKPTEEMTPKKARGQILRSEIREGIDAQHRSVAGLFVSGLSAGLDVGFSVLLMAVVWTLTEGRLSSPVSSILVANCYSIGFIFVVMGRSELFTEQTTLAVLPMLSGQTSLGSLLRLWGIVYIANLIGATAFASLVVIIAPALGTADPAAFGAIARRMIAPSSQTILLSAMLAGWLMGLLSWLVAAARDTISQIFFVWLITTCIGLVGLHHVVLGSVEVLAGIFSHQGIAPAKFGRFLLWATLGNILGGSVFVALLKYGHAKPDNN